MRLFGASTASSRSSRPLRRFFPASAPGEGARGQAITEYGVVAVVFAVLMIVGMLALGRTAGTKLNTTQNSLTDEYNQTHA